MRAQEADLATDTCGDPAHLRRGGVGGLGVEAEVDVAVAEAGRGELAPTDGPEKGDVDGIAGPQRAHPPVAPAHGLGDLVEQGRLLVLRVGGDAMQDPVNRNGRGERTSLPVRLLHAGVMADDPVIDATRALGSAGHDHACEATHHDPHSSIRDPRSTIDDPPVTPHAHAHDEAVAAPAPTVGPFPHEKLDAYRVARDLARGRA